MDEVGNVDGMAEPLCLGALGVWIFFICQHCLGLSRREFLVK